MRFLPIVQRELRTAARRRSTFRIRLWAAVIAIAAGVVALTLSWTVRGRPSLGNPVFNLLTGYVFGLCLLSGVLLSADSLSEEMRAGTLDLLFLSNLKGYDIVLGKFIARSLSALYGLLAQLPVIGISLVLGGVTGAEFCRMALALVNVVFFSLATGLGISAFVRDSQRARGNTLGVLLLLAGVAPALVSAGVSTAGRVWIWLSPFYPYWHADEARYRLNAATFWGALLGSHLLGWTFLAVASVALPWRWRERARRPPSMALPRQQCGGRSLARRVQARRELLAKNPVWWLPTKQSAVNGVLGLSSWPGP